MPIAALVLLVATLAPSGRAAGPADLPREGGGEVVGIVDGDTLVLESGREVRLVGLQAPKLPLGRPDFEPWPLAEEARKALADLALGKRIALAFGGRREDRHGRLLAHAILEPDGTWVQGALLDRGMARVYSFADNRALVPEMLARESAARRARRGIWEHPFYRILSAGEAGDHLDRFALVEGRVRAVGEARGLTFLNFGDDWRSDFTLVLPRAARRLFAAEGRDPDDLAGRLLRARGWLKERNGPMITVTHPEQIEVLD